MTMIDHNHTHQWEQIGVIQGEIPTEVEIVYQCADCDAWTSLNLSNGGRVPFRQGELADA